MTCVITLQGVDVDFLAGGLLVFRLKIINVPTDHRCTLIHTGYMSVSLCTFDCESDGSDRSMLF